MTNPYKKGRVEPIWSYIRPDGITRSQSDGIRKEMQMKFVGMGDNVVDRYVNKKVMFPGGNAVNFEVFAKK